MRMSCVIPEELAVGPLVIPQSPTWNDDLRCFHKTVHPRKLTWIPKIAIVERKYNLKPFIFGIYVRFRGCARPKKSGKKFGRAPTGWPKSLPIPTVHLIVGKVSFWRGTHDSRLMVVFVKSEQFVKWCPWGRLTSTKLPSGMMLVNLRWLVNHPGGWYQASYIHGWWIESIPGTYMIEYAW